MVAEYLVTIDKAFIKAVVLRAGGKVADIDNILKLPSVKEISDDLLYIKR